MANTIKVREVLHRVSLQLSDNAPQFKRWTCAELVHWLNDGQRVIAKFLPSAFTRSDAILLEAGSRQSIQAIPAARMKPGSGAAMDLNGRALHGVIRNMGVDGLTPGRAIRLVPRDMLDASDPNWHLAAGAPPITEYVYDPRQPQVFYVYPKAVANTWVEVSQLVNPTDVPAPAALDTYAATGGSDTTLSLDDMHVDELTNYILARAHMKDAESAASAELAALYGRMFVSSINAQAKAITGTSPGLKELPVPSRPQAE